MNFKYENQGAITYKVCEAGEHEQIDGVTLGMLTNNKIAGLAPTLYTQIDTLKIIKYNISAKTAAADIFTTSVDKKRLCGIFIGILEAVLSVEEYMIDLRTIMFDLDSIYVDLSSSETYLICVPVEGGLKDINLVNFFKEIMMSLTFDNSENSDYIGEIIKYLNSHSVLNPTDFKLRLEEIISGERKSKQVAEPEGKKTVVQPVVQEMPQQVVQLPTPDTVHVKAVQPSIEQVSEAQQCMIPPHVVGRQEIQKDINTSQAQNEGKISFMHLMMHYSKENKERYQTQKKQGKKSKEKKVKAKKNTVVETQNFVVPGAPGSQGFAVPGTEVRQVQNQVKPHQNKEISPISQVPPVECVPQVVNMEVTSNTTLPAEQRLNFGETTVLNQGTMGMTTVLNQSMKPVDSPYLYRERTAEKIQIVGEILRIGKEKSFVDYYIGDNRAISRNHANVINRNGQFYVIDKNSTNHTYLNGQQILSNEEIEIHSGDLIKLGDEVFEFKIG